LRVNRTSTVDRTTQSIYHTSKERLANRNIKNATGTTDGIAFSQMFVGTEYYGTD
jgi:hypothetical protein